MVKRIVLLFSVLMVFSQAGDKVVYKTDTYKLTEYDLQEFIKFGEFIARSSFSNTHKKQLRIWAIQSFKEEPKNNWEFYRLLHKTIMPKAKSKNRENYRVEMYLSTVLHFAKKPKHPHNLLSIVNQYNPPVKEALALQKQQHKAQLWKSQMELQSTLHLNRTMRKQMHLNTIMRLGGRVISVQGNEIVYRDKYGIKRTIRF